MAFRSFMRGALLVAGMAAGWAGSANALLLSQINGGGNPTLTVGNLVFEFDSCSGYCSSDIQIIGVPASASTGPGGGIQLVPISGTSLVDPTNYDIKLSWYVDVIGGASVINGVTGSATGTQGAGTGSIGTTVYTGSSGYVTSPGTVTTNINGSVSPVTLALLQNSLGMNTDINVTQGGGSTIKQGTIFVSEVPEPATVGLLLTGILGLAGLRRRAI